MAEAVTARHSSSERQPNCGVEQRAPSILGRAAITLGIGPHSNYYYYFKNYTQLTAVQHGWFTTSVIYTHE